MLANESKAKPASIIDAVLTMVAEYKKIIKE